MNYLKITFTIIVLSYLSVLNINSQNLEAESIVSFMVEEKPIYKGCEEAVDANKCFIKIFYEKLKDFDKVAVNKMIAKYGSHSRIRSNVVFYVNTKGEIILKINTNKNADMKQFTENFIKSLGKFEKPGFQGGKKVNVKYTMHVKIL